MIVPLGGVLPRGSSHQRRRPRATRVAATAWRIFDWRRVRWGSGDGGWGGGGGGGGGGVAGAGRGGGGGGAGGGGGGGSWSAGSVGAGVLRSSPRPWMPAAASCCPVGACVARFVRWVGRCRGGGYP